VETTVSEYFVQISAKRLPVFKNLTHVLKGIKRLPDILAKTWYLMVSGKVICVTSNVDGLMFTSISADLKLFLWYVNIDVLTI